MLQLTVNRKYPKSEYTIGEFYTNGVFYDMSLEDTDRGLTNSMTVQQILQKKVYGRTAIPKGTYRVKLTYSPKFANKPWAKKYKGLVPEILNVKGYSGVRIHPFNRASETYGCIATGKNTIKGQITEATASYLKLMDKYIWPAYQKNEDIFITIK